jgi:hypothetical protein
VFQKCRVPLRIHDRRGLFVRVGIRTGFVLPYLPEAQRQNEVVIEAIVGAARTYAGGGYDVVVDGIVGPWFLPSFRTLADRDRLAVSYVVLRPGVDTTLARARQRVGDELKDVHAITGLHAAFAQLGQLDGHAIDTSDLDAVETAATVRRLIDTGKYRLS